MGDTKSVSAKITEAWNAHDEERMRDLYADNAVFTGPGDVRLEGPDAIVDYAMVWQRAFPDTKVTVDNEIISGDWAIQQVTFTGTHTDTLASPEGEIPATNKRVTARAAEIIRVENGKVVEDNLYFDQGDVLSQMGVVPETTTTTT